MATWPTTLPPPLFSGYELQSGSQTIRTDMESGAARVRRRQTAAPDTAGLRFLLTEAQMQIFRAFWDSASGFSGGAAWVVVPIRDGRTSGVANKECRPLTGDYKAALVSASAWSVEFKVEIRNA